MKPFLYTLYGRISGAYLILLLLFATLSVVATLRFARRFTYESDQRLNRDLAQVIQLQIVPYLNGKLNVRALKKTFSEVMALNPRVDIYLLDADGHILASSVATAQLERQRVALDPIHAFIGGRASLPILGDDPRTSDEQKIFSATPLSLPSGQGYVYVVLLSKLYDSVSSLLQDDYILRTAAVNLLLVFLFTSVAGLLVFAFLTRPFRRITRAVQAYEKGQFDRRIPDLGRGELGQLARIINEMADTVQKHVAILQERDDLRREFIANISHDLRSPLTSIQGYVETAIMKNDTLSAEDRLEHLQVIREETMILSRLISQLLQLSRLDAQDFQLRPEPFAPCELVQDLILKFRPEAEQQGVELATALSQDLPLVQADIGMIERVLTNLVENAIHHTPPGGHVTIDGATTDHRVRIVVRDSGCGIPADELPRVTERFYQGRKSRAHNWGTGLGLSIVKRIVELHESELQIDSAPGEGTTISFDLPLYTPSSS